MSRAAQSIFWFGIYVVVLGATLMVRPNFILDLFGFAETEEIWIRVLGSVVFVLGGYYLISAHTEARGFFVATVFGRPALLVIFTIFVLLDLVEPILISFAAFDVAGAIWTALALRADRVRDGA